MTAQELLDAWRASQKSGPDFYRDFGRRTGISKDMLDRHFQDWCDLPHKEALFIAQRHGVDLRLAGFHAYLSEVVP